jgi:hypothetical protein
VRAVGLLADHRRFAKASTSEMEDLRARLVSSERENLQLKGILKERDAELVAATQRATSSDNKAAKLEAMRMAVLDEVRSILHEMHCQHLTDARTNYSQQQEPVESVDTSQ